MKRSAQRLRLFGAVICTYLYLVMSVSRIQSATMTTIAKNDPYPLFSTTYPYSYLLDSTKRYLFGYDECYKKDYFSLAFTGIYQKANRGSNYDREKNLAIGDLEGPWHMLGMIYGDVTPGEGVTPPAMGSQLLLAKTTLFPDIPEADPIPTASIIVDKDERVGFFSAPIKYRKHGVRFESAFQPHEDIGLLVQGGYADIKQTLTDPVNLGQDATLVPSCGAPTDFVSNVNCLLMRPYQRNLIFRQQLLDTMSNTQNVCDFRKSSFEDLRFSIWLRHIFQLNCGMDCDWAYALFIPFFYFTGSVAPTRKQDYEVLLSAPFGNNYHSSLGFSGGFHLDFRDYVEIGFYGGMNCFSSRVEKNYRLPTHPSQTGIFPFATDVRVSPGNNHHFAVSLHAYRFFGRLSAWIEFQFVSHAEDTLYIIDDEVRAESDQMTESPLFYVAQQECLTKFTSQFLTTAMNYEISNTFQLGFAVQWPLQQRNAYRSTTVLGTLRATF